MPTACSARDLVFCDIGSGCGRLVMAQALKWPWRCCRGIEKVQALHDMGKAAMSAAGQMAQREEEIVAGSVEPVASPEASRLLQAMAPCALSLGDVNEEEVCPSLWDGTLVVSRGRSPQTYEHTIPLTNDHAPTMLFARLLCTLLQINISDCDILFCYSSSFPAQGDLLTELSYTLGHKLRPGSQVRDP